MAFPPSGQTTLTETIPSYLYQQYSDDDDLQAFVAAFNDLAQEYVDWFVSIGLPIYTGNAIVGPLLDWVAQGLYGMTRPTLSTGKNQDLGPYNTYTFGTQLLGRFKFIGPQNITATSDDVFKRILTWHFYKGDGKVFNIRWLKRRIRRFLEGVNGADLNIDQTYQISVTFGTGNQVTIRIITGVRMVTTGAIFDKFRFGMRTFNEINTTFVSLGPVPPLAPLLKEGIASGALELPFQFAFSVV